MRYIQLFVLLLCTAAYTHTMQAQSLRPAALVKAAANDAEFQESYSLFNVQKSAAPVSALEKVGADYEVVTLNGKSMQAIRLDAPEALEIDLPASLGKARMVRADIFADGFTVTDTGDKLGKQDVGIHYRGTLQDGKESLVAFSVFEKSVSATISTDAGTFVLGPLRGGNAKRKAEHVIYNDRDLPVQDLGTCATEDTSLPYSPKELVDVDLTQKDANNCVNIFLEIDKSIYDSRGNGTTPFITGLFNQVATLYANEELKIRISDIVIWSTPDPYNGSSSGANLDAFRDYRTSFNGDLAHLLSFQASGGVAYVNVLCAKRVGYGFSSINNSYKTVPSYSWSVSVIAHELGHNFGSKHTHACVWNGNGTAIDACYGTEGGCGSNVDRPSGGGTIMSYCHLTSVGIDFNKGFGTQPGNLMRNRTYNASCLSACSDGDGGGGDDGGDDGGGDDNPCEIIDFNSSSPEAYGGSQDKGEVTVQEDGARISLIGNAWKAVSGDYEITANTVMTFEFGIVRPGEIHGIGFAKNDNANSSTTFQLYGSQQWGRQNARDYTDGNLGSWRSFTIPVGEYFTGTFDRMTFVNDHDDGSRDAYGAYRNIRVFESGSCGSALPTDNQPIDGQELAGLAAEEELSLFPNPTSAELNVSLNVRQATGARIRVFDVAGKQSVDRSVQLTEGKQKVSLDVHALPAGTYLLRLEAESGFTSTSRFTVIR